MSSGIIDTIKKVGLAAISKLALQVLFGKVKSVEPLVITVSDKGELKELTKEFVHLDSPVQQDEEVILMRYASGNKYLVLSTIEKVYKNETYTGGGDATPTTYSTDGKWKSLGTFKLTHYCMEEWASKDHPCNAGPPFITATGTKPHVGGCAVDPKVIKLGSYVKINGVVYHAEDTGSAIKGNRIDIVVPTHAEALQKGVKYAEVFLKVGD